jgi:hypothetical protein
VYSCEVNGRELTFGVSGLLYKSDVLMYDTQAGALWSQAKNQALAGSMIGAIRNILPSSLTTWEEWKKKHPDTMVLSLKTWYDRNCSRDPYKGYYESRRFFGFCRGLFEGHEGKELVAGVTVDSRTKAYPLDKLRQLGKTTDTFAGRTLMFSFAPVTGDLELTEAERN